MELTLLHGTLKLIFLINNYNKMINNDQDQKSCQTDQYSQVQRPE